MDLKDKDVVRIKHHRKAGKYRVDDTWTVLIYPTERDDIAFTTTINFSDSVPRLRKTFKMSLELTKLIEVRKHYTT